MLAAIAAWARVQPESFWTGGGGGSTTTSSGSVETVWPGQFIGVSIDLQDRSVVPIYQMPSAPGEASGSIIVRLESASFASSSAVPSGVTLGIRQPDGSMDVVPYTLGQLHGTDWRVFLAGQLPPLDAATVQDQYAAFVAREPSIVQSSVPLQLDANLGNPVRADARQEAALILAGAAYLNTWVAKEEIPVSEPLGAGEIHPAATLAVVYDSATGERLPVTDPAEVASLSTQIGKVVASVEAVEVTPYGRVKTARFRVATDGTARAFRVWFPTPQLWSDPGPEFTLTPEEFSELLAHESGPSPYRVQLSGWGWAAVIVGVIIVALANHFAPYRDEVPTPNPTPTGNPHQTHQLWLIRSKVVRGPGIWWPGRNCVRSGLVGWPEGYDYAKIRSNSYTENEHDGDDVFQLRVKAPDQSLQQVFPPAEDYNFTDYSVVNTTVTCPN